MLAGLGGASPTSCYPAGPPHKGLPPDVARECGGVLTSAPPGGVGAGTADRAPCPQAPVSDTWGLGLVALLLPTVWATCLFLDPVLSSILLCNCNAIEDFGTISKCKFALRRHSLLSELFRGRGWRDK